MDYVLLVYGAAFVATAFAIGVQARAAAPAEPVPAAALWALMLFALVHGAADWSALAVRLEARDEGVLPVPLALVRLALLGASFAVLGGFGLLLAFRPGPRRALAVAGVPSLALVAWLGGGAVAFRGLGGAFDWSVLATAEAWARYLLGLPACVAALVGLDRLRRRVRADDWQAGRLLGAACLAFAAYAFFASAVAPPSQVGVAVRLNTASFAAATHLPVELFRAASIAAVGLLVSEVFVLTTARHLRSEVEHLRDEFVSLVAHELRTPLNAVETGAVLLERLAPEEHGSERERRVVAAIRSGARAMGRIVSDLLDASRVRSRGLAVSPEPLDVGPLLLRMIEWAPAEAMRGHTVRLVPPGPLPPVVADPVRIEQVLSNLLSNAGKYSPPGSEIVLEARGGVREVTLSVTNAGAGIGPEDLSRVFSRRYRTRGAREGRAPGLGLGLYIASGLVTAQGGRMWARSEPGVRTTFSFTLPRAPRQRPPLSRDRPQPDLRASSSRVP